MKCKNESDEHKKDRIEAENEKPKTPSSPSLSSATSLKDKQRDSASSSVSHNLLRKFHGKRDAFLLSGRNQHTAIQINPMASHFQHDFSIKSQTKFTHKKSYLSTDAFWFTQEQLQPFMALKYTHLIHLPTKKHWISSVCVFSEICLNREILTMVFFVCRLHFTLHSTQFHFTSLYAIVCTMSPFVYLFFSSVSFLGSQTWCIAFTTGFRAKYYWNLK